MSLHSHCLYFGASLYKRKLGVTVYLGSVSLELGSAQAPVQDIDTEMHSKMKDAYIHVLVSTQAIFSVCFQCSVIAYKVLPFWAVPVSLSLLQSHGE